MNWQEVLDVILKIAVPLLTGSVAGTLVGYALNRRLVKREQLQLTVYTKSIDYTLPKQDTSFKPLRVSYGGVEYPQLSYCELEAINTGRRVISSNPFVFILDNDAQVIDRDVRIEPIPGEYTEDQQNLPSNMLRYSFGSLHPGDRIRIGVLIAGPPSFDWKYRGEEKVEIVTDEQFAQLFTSDKEVYAIAMLLSLYILVGFIPFLSEIFRSGIVLLAVPFAIRLISRWRASRQSLAPAIRIDSMRFENDATVTLSVGTGEMTRLETQVNSQPEV